MNLLLHHMVQLAFDSRHRYIEMVHNQTMEFLICLTIDHHLVTLHNVDDFDSNCLEYWERIFILHFQFHVKGNYLVHNT